MNKWTGVALAVTILSLGACGGGAPDGADAQAGVSSGGTGSYSNGPVTSLGSIVVNGIHFDQTTARVLDEDGQPVSPAGIKVGMVVDLSGTPVQHVGTRDQAQASDIHIVKALVGAVDSVGADFLMVMGQKVSMASADTRFDDAWPHGLADISAGDVVTVYGFHDASRDIYLATRIDRQSGAVPAHYVVHGVIQDLDVVNGRCRIGQQLISYQWGSGTVGLANGRVATALVSTTPYASITSDGSTQQLWLGESMTLDKPVVADKDQAALDGVVTSLPGDAAGVLSVNGIVVDTTQMSCTVCAGLTTGARVQVAGRLVSEVLVANKVSLLPTR